MLKDGRASVVIQKPFTIQLKYEPGTHVTQNITMGIDIGPESCGISVVRYPNRDIRTEEGRTGPLFGTEIFAAEVVPRKDVTAIQRQSRGLKKSRRKRDKRRKKHHIEKGQRRNRNQIHSVTRTTIFFEITNMICRILNFLPVNIIRIEDGEFMSKDIKTERFGHNWEPGYRKFMELKTFKRTETFIRDNHVCQCCFGRSKDNILTTKNVIKYYTSKKDKENDTRHMGPYLTLCKTCREKIEYLWKAHKKDPNNKKKEEKYLRTVEKMRNRHEEYVSDRNIREKMDDFREGKVHSRYVAGKYNSFKGDIFRDLYNFLIIDSTKESLKENYRHIHVERVETIDGISVRLIRNKLNLQNNPIDNARAIVSFDGGAKPLISSEIYYYRYRKYRSRSLHKVTPKKGGIRPPRSPMIVKGFSAYDEVKYLGKKHPELYGKTFFITKKRKTGYFSIGRLDGTTILNSVKYSDLKLITKRKAYSVERR
jgi:N6-L-threonylcarbamoyladenine synthase